VVSAFFIRFLLCHRPRDCVRRDQETAGR
jgi:hypothetical protein